MTPPRPLRPFAYRVPPRRGCPHRPVQLALCPHTGGTYVLRIEDTDRERSTPEHTQVILDGLTWLGLAWDEGPYFQGEYAARHQADAERLLARGEGVSLLLHPGGARRAARKARRQGGASATTAAATGLAPAEVERRVGARVPPRPSGSCCRTRRSPGRTRFTAGSASRAETSTTSSFCGATAAPSTTWRSSPTTSPWQSPTSSAATTTSPTLRSRSRSTGRWATSRPVFAHVPMILGADGKKLSKRHGATAVGDYQEQGIFPAAMRNFLALLGWSPGGDREIMPEDEMIGCSASTAFRRRRRSSTPPSSSG